MDGFDPSNPNLDGDFQALLEIQKRRAQTRIKKQTQLIHNAMAFMKPMKKKRASMVNLQDDTSTQVSTLRQRLVDAVDADDVSGCRQLLLEIHEQGRTLGEKAMRDPETEATALHRALEKSRWKVAEFLIQYGNENFLLEDFEVEVMMLPSRKTSLHILAENGNLGLAEKLLDRIADSPRQQEFLARSVLADPGKQRPRHVTALHLAAMNGYTSLIELMVSKGVDINTVNGKNDTAVLWAVWFHHVDTVRAMISLGADLQIENDRGATPLYLAVRYGLTDLVTVMVKEGHCDVKKKRKLGLESPLVLAAALGYGDILKTLLAHGGDPDIQITNNQTALHFAAMYGDLNIVQILLDHKVNMNLADDSGNTALLLATKAGNEDIVEILIRKGAWMDVRNKQGDTMWSHAIDKPDSRLLNTLIRLYCKLRRQTGRRLTFPLGLSPLHVAALKGDVDKIQDLLELGVDPNNGDQNKNTFYHLAARENKVVILTSFMARIDINCQNDDEDTPLHLAATAGHVSAVNILIRKGELNIRNKRGFTPLHSAVWSGSSSPTLVWQLVQNIIKNNRWSLLDAQDNKGNTPLHLAAHGNRVDMIQELSSLNPTTQNDDMDNPLHVAAKEGNTEVLTTMLRVFNKPSHGLDIDQQNGEGETLLHICAKNGNTAMVDGLVATGADLAKKNSQGNTVLHELAEQLILEPNQREKLMEVYEAIVKKATRWWCLRSDLPYPDEGSDVYKQCRKAAVIFLTSQVYNHKGYNVQTYTCLIGALDLFEAILATNDVYKTRVGKVYHFDITNIIPDTVCTKGKVMFTMGSQLSLASDIDIQTGDNNQKKDNQMEVEEVAKEELDLDHPSGQSCLDIIAYHSDEVLAAEFLDIVPVRQLVEKLWGRYQWIYLLLMVLHLTYMGAFTACAIPLVTHFYLYEASPPANYTNDSDIAIPEGQRFPYFAFLLWPMLIMAFEIYFLVTKFFFMKKKRNMEDPFDFKTGPESKESCWGRFQLLSVPGMVIRWIFDYLSHIAAFNFVWCVLAWMILHGMDDEGQIYPMVVAMIVGWMFTIVFTKGFESAHAFSIMLSYIIVRDITRFLFIYFFVLFGFASALHFCFLVSPVIAAQHPTFMHTVFLTFNLMIGMGEFFDEDFDHNYSNDGGNPGFIKIIYVIYMVLGTIIFLNLLIAMLSDTYNDIKSKEGTTWRVGSVRLALRIERTMPWLRRCMIRMGLFTEKLDKDPDTDRWDMKLAIESVQEEEEPEVSEIIKSLQRLDNRLDHIQGAFEDFRSHVDTVCADLVKKSGEPDTKTGSSPGAAGAPEGGANSGGGDKENPLIAITAKAKPTGGSPSGDSQTIPSISGGGALAALASKAKSANSDKVEESASHISALNPDTPEPGPLAIKVGDKPVSGGNALVSKLARLKLKVPKAGRGPSENEPTSPPPPPPVTPKLNTKAVNPKSSLAAVMAKVQAAKDNSEEDDQGLTFEVTPDTERSSTAPGSEDGAAEAIRKIMPGVISKGLSTDSEPTDEDPLLGAVHRVLDPVV